MKTARAHRLGKRDLKRAKKRAAKTPAWVNDIASSLYHRASPKFSRGAASAVRQIIKDGRPVETPE